MAVAADVEKLTADLKRWTRRLKLARTKVAKLKRKIKYRQSKPAPKSESQRAVDRLVDDLLAAKDPRSVLSPADDYELDFGDEA